MQQITDAHLSDSFIRVDPVLRRATYQDTDAKGKVRTGRLDGNDQILISDVLSFHIKGKQYYRSISSIGGILGLSNSAVSRKLKRLHQLGYLMVTVNGKPSSQTNIVELGPATINLFTRQSNPSSPDQPKRSEEAMQAEPQTRTATDAAFDEFLAANNSDPITR